MSVAYVSLVKGVEHRDPPGLSGCGERPGCSLTPLLIRQDLQGRRRDPLFLSRILTFYWPFFPLPPAPSLPPCITMQLFINSATFLMKPAGATDLQRQEVDQRFLQQVHLWDIKEHNKTSKVTLKHNGALSPTATIPQTVQNNKGITRFERRRPRNSRTRHS